MHGTGRFMCMSCGRFFSMEYSYKEGEISCPFCGDLYFCDNITLDIPPYIEGPYTMKFSCGHEIQTDFIGDIKWCPICKKVINLIPGLQLKVWQDQIIARSKP